MDCNEKNAGSYCEDFQNKAKVHSKKIAGEGGGKSGDFDIGGYRRRPG